ncbi:MAG: M13 family metallopeptidase [Candidatus Parvarchaeum sp.]
MESSERKESAKNIGFSTSYMDLSIDPFEDFYNYACGKWRSSTPIPKEEGRYDSFIQLSNKNFEILKAIAESCAYNKQEKGTVEQKVGDFFFSFMDTKTIEKKGFSPIMPLMKIVDSIKDFDDVNSVIKELMKEGISSFFDLSSAEDKKDSSIYSFYITQGGISLPDRDYYLKKEHAKAVSDFKNHIVKMFKLYGEKDGKARDYCDSIMKIENYLAEASRSSVELRDEIKNYNRFSIEQIKKRFNAIDLLGIYSSLGGNPISFMVVGQPEFLDKVNMIRAKFTVDDVKAYLKWQIINHSASLLHSKAEKEHFDFFGRKLMGKKVQEPRWKRAIKLIDFSIGEALGKLYVEQNFSREAKRKAEELVSDVKSIFIERLKAVKWMGPATRKKALKKFSMLNVKIGYPEKFRDYSKLEIERNDLFGNVTRSIKFEINRQIKRIGKKVDKKEWLMTPSMVNAYYNPSGNELAFPAGILQPPFFDASKDAAVNYGGIGGVIGHEITHGYDDQGRLYDGNGRMKEWWLPQDTRKFNALAKKVADFYSKFEIIPGVKVNGKLTLGENIADLGGISIAYDALQRYLKRNPAENKKIDGFTPEQRFFIAWSQIWKSNVRDETAKMFAMIDPHSPEKIRGLVPAVTHPKFESTFKEKSKLGKLPVKYPNLNMW